MRTSKRGMTSTLRKKGKKERKTKESKNTTSPPNSPPFPMSNSEGFPARHPPLSDPTNQRRTLLADPADFARGNRITCGPRCASSPWRRTPGECPGELHSTTGGLVPDSRQQAYSHDPRAVAAQFRRWCARACVSPAGAVLLGRFNMTCHLRLQLMLSVACLDRHLEMRCSQNYHDFQDGRELLIITTSAS